MKLPKASLVWSSRKPPADSLDRPRIIKTMNVSLWSKLSGAGVSVKLYAPVVCYL